MPRNVRIATAKTITRFPTILRTYDRKPPERILPHTPRLWNAKRRIKVSQGLNTQQFNEWKRNPQSYDWRSKVSPDVAAFLDRNTTLRRDQRAQILRYPSRYFSRPHHVPLDQRKQVYLPEFSITFIRTPKYGPYYAHFAVPLWFNKLDMKSYLKNVYNVDVVHVRSTVLHSKQDRQPPRRPGDQGKWFRHKSQKRMTTQLVEPFEWPAPPEDLGDWEKPEFWRSLKAQVDMNERQSEHYIKQNPNQEHRHAIAKQALDLLKGRTTWKPTWTQVPWDRKAMEGIVAAPKRGASRSQAQTVLPPPPPPPSLLQVGKGPEGNGKYVEAGTATGTGASAP